MTTVSPRRVLLTGAAGFVGFHVTQALLARGIAVLGIDNLTPYYDPALKQARLDRLLPQEDLTAGCRTNMQLSRSTRTGPPKIQTTE